MQWAPSRRRVLATLSSATAAGLIGGARGMAQEAPPETTTIRLAKIPGICIAPQYVAEEFLRSEGFTNVQYVELSVNVYAGFTAGTIDISMAFIAPYIIQLDAGLPLVLLGGVHAGCFELFGTDRVKSIRDRHGVLCRNKPKGGYQLRHLSCKRVDAATCRTENRCVDGLSSGPPGAT